MLSYLVFFFWFSLAFLVNFLCVELICATTKSLSHQNYYTIKHCSSTAIPHRTLNPGPPLTKPSQTLKPLSLPHHPLNIPHHIPLAHVSEEAASHIDPEVAVVVDRTAAADLVRKIVVVAVVDRLWLARRRVLRQVDRDRRPGFAILLENVGMMISKIEILRK